MFILIFDGCSNVQEKAIVSTHDITNGLQMSPDRKHTSNAAKRHAAAPDACVAKTLMTVT